jgi:CDP-diacylglycerol---glycerol-3-phosphate 3-phosphatidyltransferase
VNLPNSITIARLGLTIVYVVTATFNNAFGAWAAAITFCIAATTDWLDGYYARKLNLVTSLGKLLDPLVDKILICSAFVHVSIIHLCPMWVTILIIGREFLVTGLRQIAIEKSVVIPADGCGKLKTIFQIVFIIAALIWQVIEKQQVSNPIVRIFSLLTNPSLIFFPIFLAAAVGLTVISGFNYFRKSAELFK